MFLSFAFYSYDHAFSAIGLRVEYFEEYANGGKPDELVFSTT